MPETTALSTTRALKARNGPVLAAILLADVAVFLLAADDPLAAHWRDLLTTRALAACLAPVLVLLTASLLPASWKARLVFWRWKHALPGHRAFTDRVLNDPRIDRDRLLHNVALFPVETGEQNQFWYRLFKKVENEPSIEYINRQFLLLRDLAALSLLLLAPTAIALLAGWCEPRQAGIASAIFAVQYLLAAVSANRAGHGLVSSVLALHGAKRRV
jgi:hypothetical protein